MLKINIYLILHYFLLIAICLSFYTNNFYYEAYFLENGYSNFFVLIVIIVLPICLFISTNTGFAVQLNVLLLILELFLYICFLSQNLFIFYVFFEAILVPMFLIVGLESTGFRKIKAAYYLFLYTLFGSFFMLFAIAYIKVITSSYSYAVLRTTNFSFLQQKLLFICFFFAFAVKLPCVPVHLWLPEAHVEASTVGSILLASLILKLPGYGLITFNLNWFPYACVVYQNIIYLISCVSITYASFSSLRQLDMKKIVAYSSVAHMNLVLLGIFSKNSFGTLGAIYLMIGHAFVSSALFFSIGLLYQRYRTKNLLYYGGLVQIMPVFCSYLFIFSIANFSFPGTCNFIGEILIFFDLICTNIMSVFFSSISIVVSAIYSIWLYNRICYGAVKHNFVICYADVTFKELIILNIFLFFIVTNGICANFIYALSFFC